MQQDAHGLFRNCSLRRKTVFGKLKLEDRTSSFLFHLLFKFIFNLKLVVELH